MKLIDRPEVPEFVSPAGVVHECTMKHEDCYIAFSTHNCPFEEELSIQLYGPDGQELERIDLYGAYAGGLFTLKDISNGCMEFTFWSEDRMRLTYQHQPKRVIRQPLGVHYAKRFARHHMVVEGPFSQE